MPGWLKMFAVLSGVAVLSACGEDPATGDGSVDGVRCDGTSPEYCPCLVEENAGRRYLFCSDAVTWSEGRDKCRGFGFDLARIESAAEQAFIWSIAGPTGGEYWIGLNDRDIEGTFAWSDGTPLGDFADWADDQPDSGRGDVDEDCVEIIQTEDGQWNDRDCETDYLDYLCEASA